MSMITYYMRGERTLKVKIIDFFLYFCIFGGITLISGSIVHALEFSLTNIFMFIAGLFITIFGTIVHDNLFVNSEDRKEISFKNFGVTITIAVSSGSIAGAILPEGRRS